MKTRDMADGRVCARGEERGIIKAAKRSGVHVGSFIIKPWFLHMHKLLRKILACSKIY